MELVRDASLDLYEDEETIAERLHKQSACHPYIEGMSVPGLLHAVACRIRTSVPLAR
jgi:hypothetical protein